MIKRLFAVVFAIAGLLFSYSSWALTAMVDRSSIALDETLRLEISTHDKGNLDAIDLSGIENHFIIANTSNRRYASMINGRTEHQTTKVLTLKPRAIGNASIPSLSLGKQNTQPITITVRKPAPLDQELSDNSVIVQAEINKSSALPGEQIIYTFRLLYRVSLADGEVTDLVIPEADITALEDNSYQREFGGYNYKVVEKRYALHFKQAGSYQWQPQQLTATLNNGYRNRFGVDPFSQGQAFKLAAPTLSVNVKQKPASQSGYWLPAEELDISQQWLNASETISVGQPMSRKIIITAKGLLAEKLPSLSPAAGSGANNIAGLNIYAEKPEFVNQQWSGGIAGRREETQVIIPTTAGSYTLPAIHIQWWNTRTREFENSVLPEQTIEVVAGSDTAQLPPTVVTHSSSNDSEPIAKPDPIGLAGDEPSRSVLLASQAKTKKWQMVTAISIVGWLVTLLGWYLHARKNNGTGAAAATLSSEVGHDKRSFKQLCEACSKNNAQQVKLALNLWLGQQQLFSPDNPPLLVQQAIDSLNAALYGSDSQLREGWNGNQLLAALQSIKTQTRHSEPVLAPLYPSQ